jgi:hypothetical protein
MIMIQILYTPVPCPRAPAPPFARHINAHSHYWKPVASSPWLQARGFKPVASSHCYIVWIMRHHARCMRTCQKPTLTSNSPHHTFIAATLLIESYGPLIIMLLPDSAAPTFIWTCRKSYCPKACWLSITSDAQESILNSLSKPRFTALLATIGPH